MMSKKLNILLLVLAMTAVVLTAVVARNAVAAGRGSGPIVYVTSQGLYYDSIVVADLPPHGPFQLLEMGGLTGLMTEFGPGDTDYVGGRWWMDVNGNGEMDDEDDYFLCPLLPPGREEP